MSLPIASIEEVTPAWLTQVLQAGGYLDRGSVTAVQRGDEQAVAVGRPGFRPSQSIQASYSAETPRFAPSRLYLKIEDRAIHKLAGRREATFYTSIAPGMPYPPAAHCYHAAYDPGSGAYHLLLEDVSGTHRTLHPEEPAPRDDTGQMLDALARLHAFWWNHPRLGQDIGTLPTAERIEQDFGQLINAFPGYADFMGDRLSRERRDIYERVLAQFPAVLTGHLAERQRLTLVHNDAHAGNFLMSHDPDRQGSYIVDWQQWGVHVGARDVAYLIAVFWYPERRARMEQPLVKGYHDRLEAYGVTGYDWDAVWHDYRLHAIENLLVPLWAWIDHGRSWGVHRWHQLEKAMLAFEDLGCAEFLTG